MGCSFARSAKFSRDGFATSSTGIGNQSAIIRIPFAKTSMKSSHEVTLRVFRITGSDQQELKHQLLEQLLSHKRRGKGPSIAK